MPLKPKTQTKVWQLSELIYISIDWEALMGRGLHDEREGTTSIQYWSKWVLFRLKRTWREPRRGKGQRTTDGGDCNSQLHIDHSLCCTVLNKVLTWQAIELKQAPFPDHAAPRRSSHGRPNQTWDQRAHYYFNKSGNVGHSLIAPFEINRETRFPSAMFTHFLTYICVCL